MAQGADAGCIHLLTSLIRFLSDAFPGPAESDKQRHFPLLPPTPPPHPHFSLAGVEERKKEVDHHEIKGRQGLVGEWTESSLLRRAVREKDGFIILGIAPRDRKATVTSPPCTTPPPPTTYLL